MKAKNNTDPFVIAVAEIKSRFVASSETNGGPGQLKIIPTPARPAERYGAGVTVVDIVGSTGTPTIAMSAVKSPSQVTSSCTMRHWKW
jgi:hypothetical protein